MDKLASMTAFIKVAELGSFAEAARQLGQSRSQVNRSVIALEDSLTVTLLNRTTRKVSLTPTGSAYLTRAKSILDDLRETESLIKSDNEHPSGEMKINAPMSFGTMHLGPAIVNFMERYPDIKIQLILSDEFIEPVSNGFDMTVRIAEPTNSSALIEHNIVQIKRILCASPSFLSSASEPQTLKELSGLPCLHYGNLPSGNNWKLMGPDGEKNIRVSGILCSNNAEVLRDAAVAGMGVALLPTFIAGAELQNGRLVSILNDYTAPAISLNLLYPPNRHLSTRTRLFVNFMYERFGESPQWDLIS